jgi:hypothetical protein
MKRKKAEEINLLHLTPERLFGYSENDKGFVVVDMPRFHIPWMQKYLVPRWKNPFIRITFDEFGSYTWNLCDGSRDVHAIADALTEHFGDTIQPIYDRLGVFFRQLKSRGFVSLRKPDGTLF